MGYSKAELKTLKLGIVGWYYENRPPVWPGIWWETGEEQQFRAALPEVLRKHAIDMVLQWVDWLRDSRLNYARQARECAAHALSSGVWGKATQLVSSSMTANAVRYDKEARQYARLAEKVKMHGLPPEVADYDPSSGWL